MSLISLFFIALFVVIGILLFKLIHKVASFIVTMLLIGCILMGVLGYLDYRAIQAGKFQTEFLMSSGDTITYAAQLQGLNFSSAAELAGSERVRLGSLLNSSDLKAALGGNQKLIVVYEDKYDLKHSALLGDFRNDTLRMVDKGLRQGGVLMYPETIYFKIVRLVPAAMLNWVS